MALQRQPLDISFAQGLDTKTDKFRVQPGKFLSLENTIFQTAGLLQKRNGFNEIPTSANGFVSGATSLSTYMDGLLALGPSIQAYSSDNEIWTTKGSIQSVSVDVQPVVRTSTGCTMCDVAVSDSGLACSVFQNPAGAAFYQIVDVGTGQSVVNITALPATATLPRAFVLGRYFIITYLVTVSAATHLKALALPISNPNVTGTTKDLSSQVKTLAGGYDGYVAANNNLYLAFNASDGGGAVRVTYLTSTLTQPTTIVLATQVGALVSVTSDDSTANPTVWVTWYNAGTTQTAAYNQILNQVLGPTPVLTSTTLNEITSVATGNVNTILGQVTATYSYSSVRSDRVVYVTCTSTGSSSSVATVDRGIGLASKAFLSPFNGTVTFLVVYGGAYQPTFFLMDLAGNELSKLAYENSNGYMTTQVLPGISINGQDIMIGYLFKSLTQAIAPVQGAVVSGVYAQAGVNVVTFTIGQQIFNTSEIGQSLHLDGGFLWQYDGIKPVEHSFHLWPEDLKVTTSTTGGLLTDQQYYYVATYEWTDGQGLLHRSAPSVPYGQVTAGGNTSTNTINVPTLRLTYKVGTNPVRIVIYRWSTANQVYYQITSIVAPTANDTTVDSIAYIDTVADSSIIGNNILYTTGGVLENIAAPACSDVALFNNRLFTVNAEDRNVLSYSKQVIEAVPVEMSDLLTLFVAPTSGAQGSTGLVECLSAMDDKLIIFKANAIYYVAGVGPDNTGANNGYTDPVFITATVGCANKKSIVFMPQGLMFQSDKGIWLLGRDLSTTYIGAAVEAFNKNTVLAAVNIPGTTQVRFTLDNGFTLMYDYYYNQWGSFTNIPAISSTLYQGLHTYLDSFARILQESPGSYLDGSKPVEMQFTTGWMSMAGLQGFERAYFFYLLGTYISPHRLVVNIAYDFNPATAQSVTINPDNFNAAFGGDSLYGGSSPYGGNSNIEQWRVFFNQQKCESFQISIQEIYDPSFGVPAGAGLTLSGLNLIVGLKKAYTTLRAARSAG